MKTHLTTVILLLALGYSSLAQQAEPRNLRQQLTPEELIQMQTSMAQYQTAQMKERLNLDEEQEAVIGEINLKYTIFRTKVMEMVRESPDSLDLQTLLNELEAKWDNEILPFLNEDQVEPYYAFKQEQQQRRRQPGMQGERRRRPPRE